MTSYQINSSFISDDSSQEIFQRSKTANLEEGQKVLEILSRADSFNEFSYPVRPPIFDSNIPKQHEYFPSVKEAIKDIFFVRPSEEFLKKEGLEYIRQRKQVISLNLQDAIKDIRAPQENMKPHKIYVNHFQNSSGQKQNQGLIDNQLIDVFLSYYSDRLIQINRSIQAEERKSVINQSFQSLIEEDKTQIVTYKDLDDLNLLVFRAMIYTERVNHFLTGIIQPRDQNMGIISSEEKLSAQVQDVFKKHFPLLVPISYNFLMRKQIILTIQTQFNRIQAIETEIMNFKPLKLPFTISKFDRIQTLGTKNIDIDSVRQPFNFNEAGAQLKRINVRNPTIIGQQTRFEMLSRFVRSLKQTDKIENAETCLHLKISNSPKHNLFENDQRLEIQAFSGQKQIGEVFYLNNEVSCLITEIKILDQLILNDFILVLKLVRQSKNIEIDKDGSGKKEIYKRTVLAYTVLNLSSYIFSPESKNSTEWLIEAIQFYKNDERLNQILQKDDYASELPNLFKLAFNDKFTTSLQIVFKQNPLEPSQFQQSQGEVNRLIPLVQGVYFPLELNKAIVVRNNLQQGKKIYSCDLNQRLSQVCYDSNYLNNTDPLITKTNQMIIKFEVKRIQFKQKEQSQPYFGLGLSIKFSKNKNKNFGQYSALQFVEYEKNREVLYFSMIITEDEFYAAQDVILECETTNKQRQPIFSLATAPISLISKVNREGSVLKIISVDQLVELELKVRIQSNFYPLDETIATLLNPQQKIPILKDSKISELLSQMDNRDQVISFLRKLTDALLLLLVKNTQTENLSGSVDVKANQYGVSNTNLIFGNILDLLPLLDKKESLINFDDFFKQNLTQIFRWDIGNISQLVKILGDQIRQLAEFSLKNSNIILMESKDFQIMNLKKLQNLALIIDLAYAAFQKVFFHKISEIIQYIQSEKEIKNLEVIKYSLDLLTKLSCQIQGGNLAFAINTVWKNFQLLQESTKNDVTSVYQRQVGMQLKIVKLFHEIKTEATLFEELIGFNLLKIVQNFTKVKDLKKIGKNVPTLEELENFIESVRQNQNDQYQAIVRFQEELHAQLPSILKIAHRIVNQDFFFQILNRYYDEQSFLAKFNQQLPNILEQIIPNFQQILIDKEKIVLNASNSKMSQAQINNISTSIEAFYQDAKDFISIKQQEEDSKIYDRIKKELRLICKIVGNDVLFEFAVFDNSGIADKQYENSNQNLLLTKLIRLFYQLIKLKQRFQSSKEKKDKDSSLKLQIVNQFLHALHSFDIKMFQALCQKKLDIISQQRQIRQTKRESRIQQRQTEMKNLNQIESEVTEESDYDDDLDLIDSIEGKQRESQDKSSIRASGIKSVFDSFEELLSNTQDRKEIRSIICFSFIEQIQNWNQQVKQNKIQSLQLPFQFFDLVLYEISEMSYVSLKKLFFRRVEALGTLLTKLNVSFNNSVKITDQGTLYLQEERVKFASLHSNLKMLQVLETFSINLTEFLIDSATLNQVQNQKRQQEKIKPLISQVWLLQLQILSELYRAHFLLVQSSKSNPASSPYINQIRQMISDRQSKQLQMHKNLWNNYIKMEELLMPSENNFRQLKMGYFWRIRQIISIYQTDSDGLNEIIEEALQLPIQVSIEIDQISYRVKGVLNEDTFAFLIELVQEIIRLQNKMPSQPQIFQTPQANQSLSDKFFKIFLDTAESLGDDIDEVLEDFIQQNIKQLTQVQEIYVGIQEFEELQLQLEKKQNFGSFLAQDLQINLLAQLIRQQTLLESFQKYNHYQQFKSLAQGSYMKLVHLIGDVLQKAFQVQFEEHLNNSTGSMIFEKQAPMFKDQMREVKAMIQVKLYHEYLNALGQDKISESQQYMPGQLISMIDQAVLALVPKNEQNLLFQNQFYDLALNLLQDKRQIQLKSYDLEAVENTLLEEKSLYNRYRNFSSSQNKPGECRYYRLEIESLLPQYLQQKGRMFIYRVPSNYNLSWMQEDLRVLTGNKRHVFQESNVKKIDTLTNDILRKYRIEVTDSTSENLQAMPQKYKDYFEMNFKKRFYVEKCPTSNPANFADEQVITIYEVKQTFPAISIIQAISRVIEKKLPIVMVQVTDSYQYVKEISKALPDELLVITGAQFRPELQKQLYNILLKFVINDNVGGGLMMLVQKFFSDGMAKQFLELQNDSLKRGYLELFQNVSQCMFLLDKALEAYKKLGGSVETANQAKQRLTERQKIMQEKYELYQLYTLEEQI